MVSFEDIYKEHEKEMDLCNFCKKYGDDTSTRFLLIRSLDKKDLEVLLGDRGLSLSTRIEDRMKELYGSNISIPELKQYIVAQKKRIEEERYAKEGGLREILCDYGTVQCGIRNDRVEDIVKLLVRDRSIKTIEQLDEKIDDKILPKIRRYIKWSFYNQASNDLIEHFFISHPKVVPTLRRVPNIDFFIDIDGELIPFDLKITHIADDFFDMFSAGLERLTADAPDMFSAEDTKRSESTLIKDYYKSQKTLFNLPGYSRLSKKELLDILASKGDDNTEKFIQNCYSNRNKLVMEIKSCLEALEWWNYKFQGERLFSNNNRMFVFLAYDDSFEDGGPIKGMLDTIEDAVIDLLNNFSIDSIGDIRYYYEKTRSLEGAYVAKASSTIITVSQMSNIIKNGN